MRPIKFRGKTEEGHWVYGDFSLINSYEKPLIFEGLFDEFLVIPETVGQYTGVNDSKRTAEYPDGQPIYEGDIIKADLPQKWHDGVRNLRLACGRVYFEKGSFKVTDRAEDVRLDDFVKDVVWEVLGNVWEDGELLSDCKKAIKTQVY